MKKDKKFNNPFDVLKGVEVKPKPQNTLPATPPPQPPAPTSAAELFSQAMQGVAPFQHDRIAPEPEDPQTMIKAMRENRIHEDQAIMAHLDALVNGHARFDIACTGEYVQGQVACMNPALMKQLKDGEFALEEHLDLHGMTRDEARQALDRFILNAFAMGRRSLLVIHGRGLKSPHGPVLKEAVVQWLTSGRLGHYVLALCSARACDGGTGALYVLLKKRPKKLKWEK